MTALLGKEVRINEGARLKYNYHAFEAGTTVLRPKRCKGIVKRLTKVEEGKEYFEVAISVQNEVVLAEFESSELRLV